MYVLVDQDQLETSPASHWIMAFPTALGWLAE